VTLSDKSVLVVGGGAAGLTSALALADLGAAVTLVERQAALGGHAAAYACKATDACVRCGACMVASRCQAVADHPRITVRTDRRISRSNGGDPGDRIEVAIEPAEGAAGPGSDKVAADAVILATGFSPFDPTDKPYGYGRFPNVITNLTLERTLRETGAPKRPSDGTVPSRMAFVQCVGSRDESLGHVWCSQVCCGSALRMARLIRSRYPETEITIFFIDIQTFGRDFPPVYEAIVDDLRMVRAIPADVYPADGDNLTITAFDPATHQSTDEPCELLVLSIGLTPAAGTADLAEAFGIDLAETGFFAQNGPAAQRGIFPAGAATGPMSIPDAIRSGEGAAAAAVQYLLARSATQPAHSQVTP
jgi:heterodisulfide reductase subunit A2